MAAPDCDGLTRVVPVRLTNDEHLMRQSKPWRDGVPPRHAAHPADVRRLPQAGWVTDIFGRPVEA